MLPPGAPLVSVNDHVVEPADVFTTRLPAALQEVAPRVVDLDDDTGEAWVIGTERLPVRSLSVLAADGTSRPATRVAEMMPAVSDPDARVRAMDDDGVLVHTLLPHAIGFAGERLRSLRDAASWEAAVVAYNDFLLEEFCAVAPDRLVGVALLPLASIDAAVIELTRAAAMGARAVSFPHDLAGLGLPTLHDPVWDPLFATVEDIGLPVFVHVGSSGAPPSVQGVSSPGSLLTVSGFDVATAAVDFVFSSTLTRHPRLRLVLLEGGAGALPYVAERIDFFRAQRPEVWDEPNEARSTVEIFREQVFASFIDDPIGVRLRDDIGVSHLLWQSDFPHADSYWPQSRAQVTRLLKNVPDAEATAIAGGNARALLGL